MFLRQPNPRDDDRATTRSTKNEKRINAYIFALFAILTGSASAADSIYITTELTRNGEIVDNFSGLTGNGVPQKHRNVHLIKFRDSAENNKVKTATLEIGSTVSVTPVISDRESIRLKYDVSYVRLKKMDVAKIGNIEVDQPAIDGYKLISSDTLLNGEKREYRGVDGDAVYVYTVSVIKK
jgi:hypothetical protein